MLARSFKSAADLRITDNTHLALIRVLGMLERNELVHLPHPNPEGYVLEKGETFTGHFNMNHWTHKFSCGTVACIGGTAELLMGGEKVITENNPELFKLFYPQSDFDIDVNYDNITPEEAARALANYLTTGKANWVSIFPEQT